MDDIPDLACGQCLVRLAEDACRLVDVSIGEEIVIPRENEAIGLIGVRDYRLVIDSQMEFGGVTDLFDVVIQFSKVVDRRAFDVLVCQKSVPHQSRTSAGPSAF